jgi:hypothetical protein
MMKSKALFWLLFFENEIDPSFCELECFSVFVSFWLLDVRGSAGVAKKSDMRRYK